MKKLLVALVSGLMVFGTNSVMAYGNHYKHPGYYGHKKHQGYYGHGGHRKHHRGHNSHNAAYLAGGLILGSIIAHSYHNHHYSHRPAYRVVHRSSYHEPVVRRQIIYSTRVYEPHPEQIISGRHFYQDLEGNCYEILRSDEGDELKKQLPEETCNW